MKNRQYPPRGGPPLVYRCRGSGWQTGTRVFHHRYPLPGLTAHFSGWCGFRRRYPLPGPTAHLKISPSRIEEDVGPPGRFQVPILAGWRNLQGLKHPVGTREPFAQKIPEGWREAGSWKTEAESPGGMCHFAGFHGAGRKPVSDFLFPSSNADRSRDAVPDFTGTGRFRNDSEEAGADLSASIRPDNVGQTEKGIMEHRIRLPGLLAGKNTRHVGKSRDKPLVVYKPIGKMSERVGNTSPPPGRTDPNARENARQAWKCSSGGGEYPLREREHPFGDKKHPFGDWKYPFGDWNDSLGDKKHPLGERKHALGDWNDSLWNWNDSLGDWNDSLGNRNNSLWDRNDSLWYGNDPVKNWMETGSPGGLPVSVWNPILEGFKSRNKTREPAGQLPEKMCRSGTRMERAPVSRTGRRDGAGLGSRKAVASQLVNSSEWERYAKKRRKCRMMNNEYRMLNKEQENNIPVLRTFGYNADSNSTNIIGALHLEFFSRFVALNPPAASPRNTLSGNRRIWNENPAAAPRNICRNECYPLGMKVQRTQTLNGNMECKIRKTEDVPKASLREKSEERRRNQGTRNPQPVGAKRKSRYLGGTRNLEL